MSSVAFLRPENASKSLVDGASPPKPTKGAYSASSNPISRFRGLLLRPLLLRGGKRKIEEE